MLLEAVTLGREPDLEDEVVDPTDDVDIGEPGDETGSDTLRRLTGVPAVPTNWRLCTNGGNETDLEVAAANSANGSTAMLPANAKASIVAIASLVVWWVN